MYPTYREENLEARNSNEGIIRIIKKLFYSQALRLIYGRENILLVSNSIGNHTPQKEPSSSAVLVTSYINHKRQYWLPFWSCFFISRS